jgi:hypothetical protein
MIKLIVDILFYILYFINYITKHKFIPLDE